ncbi:uncharacterized protein LOC106874046 isoform X1 [Octopus bimaculoides]|nr:uncharacterized protein LOC106874046 isoform X1 [Octopus bimaculoides]
MKWRNSDKTQTLPTWIVQFRETDIPNLPRLTLISDHPLVRYEGAKFKEERYIPITVPSPDIISTKRTYSPCLLGMIIAFVAVVTVTAITLSVFLTISSHNTDDNGTTFNMSLSVENRKFIPEMTNLLSTVSQQFSQQICRSILYRLTPINSRKLCHVTNLTNGSVVINFSVTFFKTAVNESEVLFLLKGFNTRDTFRFSKVQVYLTPAQLQSQTANPSDSPSSQFLETKSSTVAKLTSQGQLDGGTSTQVQPIYKVTQTLINTKVMQLSTLDNIQQSTVEKSSLKMVTPGVNEMTNNDITTNDINGNTLSFSDHSFTSKLTSHEEIHSGVSLPVSNVTQSNEVFSTDSYTPSNIVTENDNTLLSVLYESTTSEVVDVTTSGNTSLIMSITTTGIDYSSQNTAQNLTSFTNTRDIADVTPLISSERQTNVAELSQNPEYDGISETSTNNIYNTNNNNDMVSDNSMFTLVTISYFGSELAGDDDIDVSTVRENSPLFVSGWTSLTDSSLAQDFSRSTEITELNNMIITKPLTSENYKTEDYLTDTNKNVKNSEISTIAFTEMTEKFSPDIINKPSTFNTDYKDITETSVTSMQTLDDELFTPGSIFTTNDLTNFDVTNTEEIPVSPTTVQTADFLLPTDKNKPETTSQADIMFTSDLTTPDERLTMYDTSRPTVNSITNIEDITTVDMKERDITTLDINYNTQSIIHDLTSHSDVRDTSNITPDVSNITPDFTASGDITDSTQITMSQTHDYTKHNTTQDVSLSTETTDSTTYIIVTPKDTPPYTLVTTPDIVSTTYDNVKEVSTVSNTISYLASGSTLNFVTSDTINTEAYNSTPIITSGSLKPQTTPVTENIYTEHTLVQSQSMTDISLTTTEPVLTTTDVSPTLNLMQDGANLNRIICQGNNIAEFTKLTVYAAAKIKDEPELKIVCNRTSCETSSWWSARIQIDLIIDNTTVQTCLTFSSDTCSVSKQFSCFLSFDDNELVDSKTFTIIVPPKTAILRHKKGISANWQTDIECFIIGAKPSAVWLEKRPILLTNFSEYKTSVYTDIQKDGCFYKSHYRFAVKFPTSFNLSIIRCAVNITSNYKTFFTNEHELKLIPEDYCADGHIFKVYPFDACSESFVHCANNYSYIANCPDHHCIDADIGICVMCDCNQSKSVTGTYEKNKSTLRYEDCFFECSCIAGGTDFDHAAIRGNCTHYLYCYGESEHVIACPNGYFYNYKSEQGTIPCERTADNCSP